MIAVDHLRIEYEVAGSAPDGHALRLRFDDIARSRLPDMLAVAFGERSDDESVWVIRSLSLDLDLDPSQHDDDLAGEWAASLSRRLQRMMREGGDDVVRFDNRAAHVAHYVVAAATGGHRQWCFASFSGLSALPVSAAVRTALLEPAAGFRSLSMLSDTDLHRVCGSLTEYDALRVIDGIATRGAPPAVDAVVDVWERLRSQPWLPEAQAALRTICRAAPSGDGPSEGLTRLCRSIQRLHRITAEGGGLDLRRVLASGNLAHLYLSAGVADAEVLAPLLGCSEAVLNRIAQKDQPTDVDTLRTPSGGLFLLLSSISELPLPKGFGDLGVLRLLILSRCFGAERALAVFRDPVARTLLDVDSQLEPEALQTWLASVPDEAFQELSAIVNDPDVSRPNYRAVRDGDEEFLTAPPPLCSCERRDSILSGASRLVLRNFCWRLPGFATASFGHLLRNFLDVQATIDVKSSQWSVAITPPPLALVLNLSGVSRCTIELPWRSGLSLRISMRE